jgi:hypothetical protein
VEQQADNKFCFKVSKTAIETIKDVKLFVEMKLCLVCMSSFRWLKIFRVT